MVLLKNRNTIILNNLLALWQQFNTKQRFRFVKLILLSIAVSIFDVISIGAVLPFVSVITNPTAILRNEAVSPYLLMVGIQDSSHLLLLATLLFGISAIVAGGMRTLLLWVTTRFTFETCTDLSSDIYLKTLYQPYEVHNSRNSSKIINGVLGQINTVIYEVILPLMIFICSIVISVVILFTLIIFNPLVAPLLFIIFGFIYFLITSFSKKIMLSNSLTIAKENTQLIKTVQDGLGSIRDIILDGNQLTYWKIYQNSNIPLRKVQASIAFISNFPKYAVESLGIVLILAGLIVLIKTNSVEPVVALPLVAAIALGAQRLLPLFQQSYACWNSIRGAQDTLKDVLSLLSQVSPINSTTKNIIQFNKQIQLKNMSFSHHDKSTSILNEINLVIPKGSRVGIIGKTGSGKSTLIDIIMGLVMPSSGTLEIDQEEITFNNAQSWQANISHVPQRIYISDSTIKENIAFGIPADSIDLNRVKFAAQQAQISSFIESMQNGYDSNVGERGIRLSGGQCQRIGIARALYKQANIIIFDESTSALDYQTEEDILNTINGLNKNLTIIIVTHRLSTLKICTKIYELNNGKLNESFIN